MLVVFLLLGVAGVLLLVSPMALTLGRWQVRFPRLALTLWFGAFFAGCGAAIGSVVASLMQAVGVVTPATGEAIVVTVIAWMSLVAISAAIAIVGAVSEPLASVHHNELRQLTPLIFSREQRKGFILGRFADDAPVAYAVRRPERMIIVSTALLETLTTAQLQAVLAHERAHLRARHDWVIRLAEVNAACLPARLPAGAALRRATSLLIELAADDAAARQAGAVHLANALSRLAKLTGDPGMEFRAKRLTLRRWPPAWRVRVPEALRV